MAQRTRRYNRTITKKEKDFKKGINTGWNTIGLFYIYNNEPEALLASIDTQIEFVDHIVVIDNTPPSIVNPKLIQSKLPGSVNYIHAMEYGSGFYGEAGHKPIDLIAIKERAIDELKKYKVDFIVYCDADEFFSPQLFNMLRVSAKGISYEFKEVFWETYKRYKVKYTHLRAWATDKKIKWVKELGKFADPKNVTRHNFPKYGGKTIKLPDLWHNHVRYIVGKYWKDDNRKKLEMEDKECANYEYDKNMLYYGEWPKVYKNWGEYGTI